MSLHADVAVPARDPRRLERLCRYVARPPLAVDRFEATPDGRLAYRLKTRWRDGTTHVLMERHELLERLAPLVPTARAHQVRYHGLLAPCAGGRDRVGPHSDAERAKCGRTWQFSRQRTPRFPRLLERAAVQDSDGGVLCGQASSSLGLPVPVSR